MSSADYPLTTGWGQLFRLVAPVHLAMPVEGDLAEDYHAIALEYGAETAGRWLVRQLRRTTGALFWRELTHSPWKLLGIAVVATVIFFCLLSALTKTYGIGFPHSVSFWLLPFVLGSLCGLLFKKRELSSTLVAGILSCFALAGAQMANASPVHFFSIPNCLFCSMGGALAWTAGGVTAKLLRVRDYELSQQDDLRAAYQKIMHFEYSTMIDAPVEKVFSFHERPDAIRVLTPWWLFPSIERLRGKGLEEGVEVVVTTMGVTKWHAKHVAFERNKLFVDEMVSGPMKSWRHEHRFTKQEHGTLLTDSIDYVPIGPQWPVKMGLGLLFRFRHSVTKKLCEQR